MVNNHKPGQRICDVGCGTGVGALSFATVLLQEKGVLISSDFCPQMVEIFKARFEASGFNNS
jgi:ubiquinone/menaquinone biosynthesis C-methylase UbiE